MISAFAPTERGVKDVTETKWEDDLGPAKIVQVNEPRIGLKAVLVVDNVACGPSIGGLRMAPDVTVEECMRLARAMTLKNAAAGLAHGGGKSVLIGDARAPRAQKEALIRAFAHALRNEADYIFGPDMGTDEGCMAWVKDEISRAVGLPAAIGGIPLDEIGATGWGIKFWEKPWTEQAQTVPVGGVSLEHVRPGREGRRISGCWPPGRAGRRGTVGPRVPVAGDGRRGLHTSSGPCLDAAGELLARGPRTVSALSRGLAFAGRGVVR